MTIKKVYVELVSFLEENQSKKVSTILDELKSMCESKNSGGSEIGTTFHKNDEGETIAIFCYYFKKWMKLEDVEVGLKANTSSGYNTMCKEGVSNWTKQQRVAKSERDSLLDQLGDGSITVDDLPTLQEEIEVRRKLIKESDGIHYNTLEELLSYQ